MADVLINQAYPSSAAPINAAKWDSPLVVSGGDDGQVAMRDSPSPQGAKWAWMVPAEPVTNYEDIPNGQVRFYHGGSPTKFALVYNDNGTYVEMSVTP